ncbi:MAG TPA: long-chain fatty acid--CoA ligase [Actinomycetota bacterium]|nr:long-chain fatty acid--CoA ligase [Actinomycetota bacterium]
MSLNLGLLLRESASAYPDNIALAIGDTDLTYRTVDTLARRFAGALRALAVEPGRPVALLIPNVPQFTICYFGCHYAGNPVVPLNVLLTPDEIAYHLEDSGAAALVAWEGFAPGAQAAHQRVDTCAHLILAKANPTDLTAPEGAYNLTAVIQAADPVGELPPTEADDTAVILYTSGTTGKPKGAELTHFNLFFNALTFATKVVLLEPGTVALATLPLFHIFGQTCMQNGPLVVGGTVVLVPRFEPKAVFDAMESRKVSFFGGVPTMYVALLHYPEAAQYDLSSLRRCVSGGAPMPVEVMRAFDEKYDVSILEGYGLSETSPVATFNHLHRPRKPGSIGTPIWGIELRLTDEGGRVIDAPDTPGEIEIKGPNIMKGYWRRPAATAESIHDGWFSTGDIAIRDADGFYFIVDRKKDMILRGGFSVFPREIEEVLYAHPAVAEAAVIGLPHPALGEEIHALIVLKPGAAATEEELIAYCREHLAAYKYPRGVVFRDALPKTATGKILKRELRADLSG